MDIINEIKKRYKNGSIIFKLIFINVGVFIIVNLFELIMFLFSAGGLVSFSLQEYLAVPADLNTLLYRPWTVITYMFLHYDFLHILFNMLWLFWFGKIFLEYLEPKRMLSIYLIGGISGAALYIAAFNLLPAFDGYIGSSVALGASASVYAIVIAISAFVPDYTIGLLFIGRVKLKYIALFVVGIDILSIAKGNAGGHIAHLGGAFWGYLFISQMKHGINQALNFRWLKFRKKFKVYNSPKKTKKNDPFVANGRPISDEDYNAMKNQHQQKIDRILEKISKSGYSSLSKEEKELLFSSSNKK
jgi:membrane associated rhomboid family serine protease